MNFISELKRRNVIRMAGLYLVGAWLLTQVAGTVLPMFGAPGWIARSIVVLLALGFIPAMAFAWIFELTPDGLKRDAEVTPEQSIAPQTARKMERSILVLFAIALAFFGFDKFYLAPKREAALVASTAQAVKAEAISSTQTASSPINSIAVLPFQNKNSDADTEYLSDGLAESLIYRLAQLPNLKVSPSSSIFRYKGKDIDPVKVATELGVSAVMTGRLVQRGDDLSISVELLDVRNNKLLWGEQYNRKMSELLATQREIAVEITNKLQLKLSGSEVASIEKKYTKSPEAYRLYLKGQFFLAKRSQAEMEMALDFFEQAVALDPDFALAHVAIADALYTMTSYSYRAPLAIGPRMRSEIETALRLDPTLAVAYSALGSYQSQYEFDWQKSESAFKKALSLDAGSADTKFDYAIRILLPTGRLAEAIDVMQSALEREPFNIPMQANLARAYLYAGRYPEAVTQARNAYAMDSSNIAARYWLVHVLANTGKTEEAAQLADSFLSENPDSNLMRFGAAISHANAGNDSEARGLLKSLQKSAESQYVAASWQAYILAQLGDKDAAMDMLEKAYQDRDWNTRIINVDPQFKSLRDNPRFKALVKKLGLEP